MKKIILSLLILPIFIATIFAQDCVPIIVNHFTVNGVAPISTIATYAVTTNIPGEPDKCWITSNLGSTHEATSPNDVSASGWYWQFGVKQGYAYAGSRLPETTWNYSVSTNSNWLPSNDPCTIELGAGWHIPTLHEWTNVDAGWTSLNNAFASPLKLSASGYLYYRTGVLMYANKYAMYWSNEQVSVYQNYAYNYTAWNATSNTSMYPKSMGMSIRCVK